MKITKQQFEKLYSDDISKKEYDEIISLIDERFGEVVVLVYPKITAGSGWFVYGNYDDNSEKDEGFFDLKEYKNKIEIGGRCSFPAPYNEVGNGNGYIPTRWLWTEDAEILKEFNAEIKKYKEIEIKEKEAAKRKREEKKIQKQKMKELIKAKLTKEELKYISFK